MNQGVSTHWPAEIAQHRRFLWGLARLQLGHDGDAEDVVQDTLIAAARGWQNYTGATPVRAWLTGILKRKIVDAMRSRRRQAQRLCDWSVEEAWDPDTDFTAEGRWDPATFVDHQCPETLATRSELLGLVEICMTALPPRGARLLLMREYLGLELDEITATAGVTSGNLRVILHRARLQLRRCVVKGWGEYL